MIETVFLDLDDTILDFHRAETEAIRDTFIGFGLPSDEAAIGLYKKINRECWESMERGEILRDEVLTRRFEILFSRIGASRSPAEVQAFYERRLSVGHYFMPGSPELLLELYGKYRLYIATNGTPVVQSGRMASAGIERYFDGLFISAEIGYNKPSPEFFEIAFSRIPNFRRDRAIIIGDSPSSDILGGKNAKILTCLFDPKGDKARADITADFTVRDLSEIPELLKSL